MEAQDPSSQTTLLILLGASEWSLFPEFQSSKAFANAVRRLKAYFLNPQPFGLPAENLLDLFDSEKDADELDVEISQFLERRLIDMKKAGNPARDLLLYFIGHAGFVGRDADLYLAVRHTRMDNPRASGYSMLALADTLTEKARHLRRIIILDCCFAAAAFAAFQAGPAQVAIEKTNDAFEVGHRGEGFPAKGTTLLCSSGHKAPSLLLPDGSSTMFMKAFLDVLVQGTTPQRDRLSLRNVKDLVADVLSGIRNAPRPVVLSPDQSEGDVADIPFFPNPCAQEERARQAEEERRRLAEEAERAHRMEEERQRKVEEERRRQAEEQARKEEEEQLRRAEEERGRQAEEQVRKAEPRAITAPGSLQPAEAPIIQTPVPPAGSIWSGQSLPPTILAPVPSPAPSPTKTPRKVSRRTVLIGLTAGGVVVVGGGITWTWRILTTPHPHALYTYRGHSANVWSVAWSPNGKRIASAGNDKTVQVWNAADGGNVYIYRGHSNNVSALAWSPDGKRIASGDWGGIVQVWSAADGGNVYTYPGHNSGDFREIHSVAWSPDSRRIASGSWDNTVQVWDAADGGNIYTYRGHSAGVDAVAWSPDGKRIASAGGSPDNTVQVWDAANGGNVYTYRGHSANVWSVAWSPNGKRIASAGNDKTVQVWDATNGGNVYTYRGHSDHEVYAVAWSPDGKRIASAASGGDIWRDAIQVWNAADGGNIYTYYTGAWYVAWSPDGKYIASASAGDNTVQVWGAM